MLAESRCRYEFTTIEQPILLPPHPVDPLLERLPLRARLAEQLRRHVQPAHVDGYAAQAAGDEVPHRRLAAGVRKRHVEDGVELVTERAEGEAERADARPQQMAVRRLLVLLLLAREARPLEEDRHGHRYAPVAPADPPGHDEVAAALLRMPRQVVGRV